MKRMESKCWKVLKRDERQSTGFVCTDITSVFIFKVDHIIKTAQTTSPNTLPCSSHGSVCAPALWHHSWRKSWICSHTTKPPQPQQCHRALDVRAGQSQGAEAQPGFPVLTTHSTHRPPNHAPSSQEKSTHRASVGGVHSLEKSEKGGFNHISSVLGKL